LIQEKIKWVFNYQVSVVLISANELQGIISTNPFLIDSAIDTKKLHITFLVDGPAKSILNQVKEMQDKQDEFVISGQEVYLHCPNGYGRTKYSNAYFEKKLGNPATTRSWQTVVNLADIANQTSSLNE